MPATRTKSRKDGAPTRARPRSDAYVGLLVIALLAQVAGGVFLYLDYKEYPDAKPKKVQDRPTSAPAAKPGAPQGGPVQGNPPPVVNPPGNPPGNPPPGNPPGMPPGMPPGGPRPGP